MPDFMARHEHNGDTRPTRRYQNSHNGDNIYMYIYIYDNERDVSGRISWEYKQQYERNLSTTKAWPVLKRETIGG